MSVPARGEVWDLRGRGGQLHRVAIVSDDGWNEATWPQAVAVVRRHGATEALPFLVALNEPDPVGGAVLVMDSLGPVDRDALVTRVGMLTGATMDRVAGCLRDIFDL